MSGALWHVQSNGFSNGRFGRSQWQRNLGSLAPDERRMPCRIRFGIAEFSLRSEPAVSRNTAGLIFSAKEKVPVLKLSWIADKGRNRHLLGRTRM
jgi:hypothetical protein